MAKKNSSQQSAVSDRGADQNVVDKNYVEVADLVYDLESLWSMKFRDPMSGQICMVRKAFKPRGKLELYSPER